MTNDSQRNQDSAEQAPPRRPAGPEGSTQATPEGQGAATLEPGDLVAQSLIKRNAKTFFGFLGYIVASRLIGFDETTTIIGMGVMLGLRLDLLMFEAEHSKNLALGLSVAQAKFIESLLSDTKRPDPMRPRSGFKAARQEGKL